MATCTICCKNNTRLPDLPCGPCRKVISNAANVALPSRRGSAIVSAAVTYLVLISSPIYTGATAMPTNVDIAALAMRGGASREAKKLSGFKYFNESTKNRMLEADGELNLDVNAALAAATIGGDDAHPSDDGHNDIFDGSHEANHEDEHNDNNHNEHHDEIDSVSSPHGSHDDAHDEQDHDEHHSHNNDEPEDEFHTLRNDSHEGEKPKPWGYVILSTIVVNFASLSGLLLLLIPSIHRGYLKLQGHDSQVTSHDNGRLFDVCIPAFAVGALMSTAFFLVMPEALHLIEGKHSDESDDGHSDHRLLEGDDHENHSGGDEDTHVGHDDSSESVNAAKFGCAVLGGFVLPMLFGMLFHGHSSNENRHSSPSPSDAGATDMVPSRRTENNDGKLSAVTGEDDGCDCCTKENPEDVETGVAVREVVDTTTADDRLPDTIVLGDDDATPSAPQARLNIPTESVDSPVDSSMAPLPSQTAIDYSLVAAVVVGDAFCNFVDGLFVGAAFLSCSWATTLSILMVTLFHELPQELADFLLLTRYAGLSTIQACIINFGSGLIVTLGGLVVLAGSTSDEIVGVILAMAGGCYINIAACEMMPRMEQHVYSLADRASMVLSFIVGTVPIGLVLLKHEHC